MVDGMNALIVESVAKSFERIRAVQGISFRVPRGKIFALLGPNGAGKTTLVRMLMGIIRPDSGSIAYFLDGELPAAPKSVQLGYLPEDRGLYPDVPILRTLTYFGVLRGMASREARIAAQTWLKKLGLEERERDKLETLSKGNQQKVQFIASIIHQPVFAVLDEPFAGLDPLNQDYFLQMLRELRDDGTTIVLSAHQMELVEKVADHVLLMSRGKAVLAGTLDEIRRGAHIGARLSFRVRGAPDFAVLARHSAVAQIEPRTDGVVSLLLKDGECLSDLLVLAGKSMHIESVHSERLSLHDIYVSALGPQTVSQAEDER